jgi:hypothetical protein
VCCAVQQPAARLTPLQASKLWASLAYQGRNSGAASESFDSKLDFSAALNTPATKPNPVRLVPETPASFGSFAAAVVARSKPQKIKVKPRRTVKRPTSYGSSSSSSSSSSVSSSDSELDGRSEQAHSPIVISHGSFVVFMDEQKPAAAAAYPAASAKELVSILNAQWRQLTPQQQQKCVRLDCAAARGVSPAHVPPLRYQDPHSPVVTKKVVPPSPSSPLPVMRKPPPKPHTHKVVRVDSSEDDMVNISSSSSSSSSNEGDSDDSGFSSGHDNDGDALSAVFSKCRQYAMTSSLYMFL